MFGAITDNATLRRLYSAVLERLQPDICCDIGANDGQAALLAKEAAPGAEIFAFEANPEIHALHRARLSGAGVHYLNLAMNDRSGDVTVFAPRTLSKAWVGDGRVVETSIAEPSDGAKTSLLLRNEAATYTEFRVPAESLDGFFTVKRSAVENPRFALWIDLEGAAALALKGAENILESTDAIFVEVENYRFWVEQRTAADVAGFLRARGFVPMARDREYGDDQFNILFLKAARSEQMSDLLSREIALVAAGPYPRSDLPVIIPAFNNPTYLRRMIEQLARVGLRNVTIVDNASSYPPMLNYLDSLKGKCSVIRQLENRGPRYLFRNAAFLARLPQFFCITDPDLQFHRDLPSDFLEHLIDLTCRYRIGKAGFALDITNIEQMIADRFQIGEELYRIWEWEAQFWKTPLQENVTDVPYRALIDTTFALYNKDFFRAENYLEAIRVAGRYTARHLPWYLETHVPGEEGAFYRGTSKYSFYAGTPPRL